MDNLYRYNILKAKSSGSITIYIRLLLLLLAYFSGDRTILGQIPQRSLEPFELLVQDLLHAVKVLKARDMKLYSTE